MVKLILIVIMIGLNFLGISILNSIVQALLVLEFLWSYFNLNYFSMLADLVVSFKVRAFVDTSPKNCKQCTKELQTDVHELGDDKELSAAKPPLRKAKKGIKILIDEDDSFSKLDSFPTITMKNNLKKHKQKRCSSDQDLLGYDNQNKFNVVTKMIEHENKGTPNFKNYNKKFFHKTEKVKNKFKIDVGNAEPDHHEKQIVPRMSKVYCNKELSARSSIDNIERKYSDCKPLTDSMPLKADPQSIEWTKYFDVNNEKKLKAQKIFTNMIIHDIKNPALTIEQALENLEELIGIHDISEEDDINQPLCSNLKDSLGIMKSENIESKEKIPNFEFKDSDLRQEEVKSIGQRSNKSSKIIDQLFEYIDEYPAEKTALNVPSFEFWKEGVRNKQRTNKFKSLEVVSNSVKPSLEVGLLKKILKVPSDKSIARPL